MPGPKKTIAAPAESTATEPTLRTPLFVSDTPFTATPKVVCYEDTYEHHIPAKRQGPATRQTASNSLAKPNAVVRGTSNPNYVAFVNSDESSSTSGAPFVVFVDPAATPMPTVATMGHRRDFKDLRGHDVLWVRPVESDDDKS